MIEGLTDSPAEFHDQSFFIGKSSKSIQQLMSTEI